MMIGRVYEGRVQGVGFRATTRSIADGLGVGGRVRNEPDGTVRLVASGDESTLGEFERAVEERLGGYIAGVTPFEPDDAPAPGGGFEVRR